MVCQHNGQLYSERAERYEMDEASDSGESNKSSSGASKTLATTPQLHIYMLILAVSQNMFILHLEINVVH